MLLSTRTLLVCYLRGHSSSTCQLLPNNTVQAADLLVGVNSVVFAWEVLQAACSTVSDRQGRVLGPQYRTLLRMCCTTKKGTQNDEHSLFFVVLSSIKATNVQNGATTT